MEPCSGPASSSSWSRSWGACSDLGRCVRYRPRVYRYVTALMAICTTAVAILMPLLVTGEQPYAFGSVGSGYCGAPGPTADFYGTCTINGWSMTWGPGPGWYFAVAAALVLITAMAFLVSSFRTYPYGESVPST